MNGQAFLLALRDLTRLPVPADWSEAAAGLSLLYYPLVGLLMGLSLALLALALQGGDLLASALLVAAWAALGGAGSLGGLTRSADAWAAGGDAARTREIMRAPFVGPTGAACLVLVLGIKWSAITGQLAEGQLMGLLLAPVLARTAVLGLLFATPYLRSERPVGPVPEQLPRRTAGHVLLLVMALTIAVAGHGGIWALLAAFAVLALVRAMLLRRVGAATRAGAGALVELVEVAALAAYAL